MAQATQLFLLTASVLGPLDAERILNLLYTPRPLSVPAGPTVSRAVFAQALNVLLFVGLLDRVPSAATYASDVEKQRKRIRLDHGALRTITAITDPVGDLPQGAVAFERLLEPLGYALAGTYPLDRLKMTGMAYAHLDFPEEIPQFFVSELHVDRFSPEFQRAANRVFGNAMDPLGRTVHDVLKTFSDFSEAPIDEALTALPECVGAFGRSHAIPYYEDYETLRRESAEAAWIATEGSVFNHAADRVNNVAAVAARQRCLGRSMKDAIEISSSGRVHQTAFRADPVMRRFRTSKGEIDMAVPGSFFEFISRKRMLAFGGVRRLELGFDSGNAQAIFKMTAN
jgi:hypothetical protein